MIYTKNFTFFYFDHMYYFVDIRITNSITHTVNSKKSPYQHATSSFCDYSSSKMYMYNAFNFKLRSIPAWSVNYNVEMLGKRNSPDIFIKYMYNHILFFIGIFLIKKI